MKIAPVYRAMHQRGGFDPVLVHTGQHFDKEMSDNFISTLGLPTPDKHLEIGPGSQARQIAQVIERIEPVIMTTKVDLTIVVGDVSSTLAAALASSTARVPVAHIEAGLRSRDWSMPEERNRVLTDRLSSFLFTPSSDGDSNLISEGIEPQRIHMVGNVMIDSLDSVLPLLPRAEAVNELGLSAGRFCLVTLHRPSNVDDPAVLGGIVGALTEVAREVPVVFPVHPRTARSAETWGLRLDGFGLITTPPLDYLRFAALLAEADLVLTDSGGVQEEATVLGTPCLTLRENTERPITIEYGGNELVGSDPAAILTAASRKLAGSKRPPRRPPLWDGHAAERIVRILADHFEVS
jgi:UDP-N-acetylglucosamine 2-epimerase (non-hydrolysing)